VWDVAARSPVPHCFYKNLIWAWLSSPHRYGRSASQRIWQLSQEGARDLIERLRRHRIACDLAQRDTIYCATTVDAARTLRCEFPLREKASTGRGWHRTQYGITPACRLAPPFALEAMRSAIPSRPVTVSCGLPRVRELTSSNDQQ
jgi:hypothetical protein